MHLMSKCTVFTENEQKINLFYTTLPKENLLVDNLARKKFVNCRYLYSYY